MAEEVNEQVATIDWPLAFSPPRTHIVFDERGRPWIEGTTMKVIEMVNNHLCDGSSAEQLFEGFPHIPLAKIHAALAYYYDNKAAFDEQIKKELEEYERQWAAQADTPLRKRLREQRQAT